MADTYDVAPPDALAGVRAEFERFLQLQVRLEEQTRRTNLLKEKERLLGEEEIRQSQKQIEAQQRMIESGRQVASTITTAGRIFADVLGGRFLSVIQTLASTVAQRASAAVKGAGVPVGTAAGEAAAAGGAGSGAAAAGRVAGSFAGAVGAAAAVVGSLAQAAQSAYGSLMSLAQAASPALMGALSQAFQYLAAVVGQAVLPAVFTMAQGIVYFADLLNDVMPSIPDMIATAGKILASGVHLTVQGMLFPIALLENGIALLAVTIGKLGQAVSYLAGWVAGKIGWSSGKEAADTFGDKVSAAGQRVAGADMITGTISKSIVSGLGELAGMAMPKGGRWDRAGETVATTAKMLFGQQTGGGGGFEGTTDAFRRIQESAINKTPIEHEIHKTVLKCLDLLEKIAGSNNKIEKKTGPQVVK